MQHDPSVVQRHPVKVCKGMNALPVLEFKRLSADSGGLGQRRCEYASYIMHM